jgi:uncharacterized protein (TIGR03067 family)
MRLLLALLAGFLLATPASAVAIWPPNKKTPAQPPADNLQGTWVIGSMQLNGQEFPWPVKGDPKISISAGKMIWVQYGKPVSEATYKVDNTKNPKQIQSTFIQGSEKGKVYVLIYSLEGDTLKLGTYLDGKQAPRGFGGKDDEVVIVLKRQKG